MVFKTFPYMILMHIKKDSQAIQYMSEVNFMNGLYHLEHRPLILDVIRDVPIPNLQPIPIPEL